MDLWSKTLFLMMRSFRLSRARLIKSHFPNIDEMSVLDLGGSTHFWDMVGDIIKPRELSILNIALDGTSVSKQTVEGRYIVELYDGTTVPYDDNSFDLVICNSVIEHVPEEQRGKLASEIMRVSTKHVVQTPAMEFPIEPHFVAPVVHWLPRELGRKLVRFTPRGLFGKGRSAEDVFDETHLLRHSEFQDYFPQSDLVVERILGLPKSYLIVGK